MCVACVHVLGHMYDLLYQIIYIYIYIYTYTYTRTRTHTHIHTHIHRDNEKKPINSIIYIYTHTHTHTHIYIYIHTHTHRDNEKKPINSRPNDDGAWERGFTGNPNEVKAHIYVCIAVYEYIYCDLQNNCKFDRPLKNAWMRGIPIQGPFFIQLRSRN